MQAILTFTTIFLSLLTLTNSAPLGNTTLPIVPRASTIKVTEAIHQDFADPSILLIGSTWYAYATNGQNHNVQIARSNDFKTWTTLPADAMPTVGAWVDASSPQIWAPHVVEISADSFVLYYSGAVDGGSHHCVGAATSSSPTGPFHPRPTAFACPLSAGGAVDASGFRDPHTGQRYVLYKIDGNSIGHGGICGNTVAPIVPTPIMLQAVAGDGITPQGGATQILDRGAADGPLIEAPSLMKTGGGKFVLFFSSNCYSTTLYDVSYAMASSVTGPYVKYGPFAVTGTDDLVAPGGATVSVDGVHMVFHANNGTAGYRAMYTAEIAVDWADHFVSTD